MPEKEDMPEQIYAEYPKKVAKPQALIAIKKAIKKHGFSHVLKKTQEYRAQRDGDLSFVPNPATWFNGERYNDDPSTWGGKNSAAWNSEYERPPLPYRIEPYQTQAER